VPEEYRVVETLLRTSIGKVEKKTLRILPETKAGS
jgi:non-ribosomal peptide synthetase component E (peptide arylation enzyme)